MTTEANLHGTTDASVWAREWCRIAREIEIAKDGRMVIDEDWMISWFANAIMAGHAAARVEFHALAAVKALNDKLYAKAQEAEARAGRLLVAYEAQQELAVQAGELALRAAPTSTPTREQWQAAVDYIELLESCQDGYYRASESGEANRWKAIAAALSSPVGETPNKETK